jgi:hypothetical protein
MLRAALLLIAAAALAGCESFNNPDSARLATNAPTSPQLAAYAASHPYPTTQPSDHWRVACVVNRGSGTIKIYNFDTKPLRDADVWVNKAFVQHIGGIAPNSSVVIRTSELYNGLGQSYSSLNNPVSSVQIQMGSEFHNVMGPAAD